MIVPMKFVTLVTLERLRGETLEALRRLGVMHVSGRVLEEKSDRRDLKQRIDSVARTIAILRSREPGDRGRGLKVTGEELAGYAEMIIRGRDEMTKTLSGLENDLDKLRDWGDFDPGMIDELRRSGVRVVLCSGTDEDMARCREIAGAGVVEEVWRSDRRCGFAVVSTGEIDADALPCAVLPAGRMRDLEKRCREYRQMLISIEADLDELSASVGELKRYQEALSCEYDLLSARDTMSGDGDLAVLEGFVPDFALSGLEEAAAREGWALGVRDPEPDEKVPVLLKMPSWVRPVRSLLDFLGIMPGYLELDVSPAVFVFFSIFFGMIVNDAGYGALFGAATAFGWYKAGKRKAARMPLVFFTILSGVALIWGALCGSWFGFEFGGLEWLASSEARNQHVQLICFSLGLSQLVLGRVWQALTVGRVRPMLGHIGWALVLAGNFVVVLQLLDITPVAEWAVKLMYGCYGAGLLLVIVGAVNWLNPGDVFQFPFSVINSFVDLLSYIRLFAVGLAGYYIAYNFNQMGMNLLHVNWLLLVPGLLVIFFGHALNICLCMMSVLVHGVRLNTLEFSNHAGISWSGSAYHPLADRKSEN